MSCSRREALRRAGALGAGGLAAGLLPALGGCGFRPLNATEAEGGPGGAGPNALANIKIALIADRVGQDLRNQLLDRLTPRGQPDKPSYILEVHLRETIRQLGIRSDATATYASLELGAESILIDPANGRPVFRAQHRSFNSYNIVRSAFANLLAEQDARRRAVVELAEDIQLRVGLFLTRRAT
jgi:LPS-assembly lipoprotein